MSDHKIKPINLRNPAPENAYVRPPSSNIVILPLLITAIIFFGLGFAMATLLSEEEASPTRVTTDKTAVNVAVQQTFMALTPTATPLPTLVPSQLAVMEHNPAIGPTNAPILFVEFSDYQCPYCSIFHASVRDQLLEHYGELIRYVFRDYPIIGLQESAKIAGAVQCAGFQGKFWEYSSLIWTNQNPNNETRLTLDENALLMFGDELDLDRTVLQTCIESETGLALVAQDFVEGQKFNIDGTPSFLINGRMYSGALPVESFLNIIDAELLRLGITPPDRSTET